MLPTREDLDEACPGLVDNPYLGGHWPHPRQWLFLHASMRAALQLAPNAVYEALYGGAAGGGKSDAALMAAAQMAWLYPGSHSVIIRRTHQELTKPGALQHRAMQWWLDAGVVWSGQDAMFRFPNGSVVQMGYHAHIKHDAQYQGADYQLVIFDELTYWPDDSAYMHLRSRIRRGHLTGVPLRLLAASNPGGPGHVWVKRRFLGGHDPLTGETIEPLGRYFPATIEDNPSLDREAYIENLMHLHPTRREQLLRGNWDAREPGDYFRSEWFGPLLTDLWHEALRIRWWDLAASTDPSAARTAGVRMARSPHGARAIEHAIAFRATPGARDDRIIQTAQADGHAVTVGIEIEGGSGGPAQFHALERRLNAEGFRVVGARPRAELTDAEGKVLIRNPTHVTGKQARWDPVASCLERGHQRRGECPDSGAPWWGADIDRSAFEGRDGIRLFAGPWTQGYLDEVEGVPGDGDVLCDLADATAGAWAWLETRGFSHPPAVQTTREDDDLPPGWPGPRPIGGKDQGGRWRP